jgi:hypothetical protein
LGTCRYETAAQADDYGLLKQFTNYGALAATAGPILILRQKVLAKTGSKWLKVCRNSSLT